MVTVTLVSSNPATGSAGSSEPRAIVNGNVGLLDRLGRADHSVRKDETMMRRALLAGIFTVQFGCTPLLAQVNGTMTSTPGIAATSPLGMTPGAPVPPPGIPLGATELSSPGLSPMIGSATSTPGTGMVGYGTACSPNQSSGLSGLSTVESSTSGLSTYDGGGISMGSAAVCAPGLGGSASSSTSTSNLAGGSVGRTGIPLGSVEIGNSGISPLVAVPAPAPPTFTAPSIMQPAPPPIVGSGTPCGTTGSSC
jgi:hypothetical protein